MRKVFYLLAIVSCLAITVLHFKWPAALWAFTIVIPLIALGVYDVNSNHNVLRNYPIIGHLRYMFEFIRPEIQQYFIATNLSGRPFNRQTRDLVYQRSKGERDTLPFGTQHDITSRGYEYAYHSMYPVHVDDRQGLITFGGPDCSQPYTGSRLNVSAMSFGALSPTAVSALNLGAKIGGFAQNTGEGGLSKHHRCGGDLIWQIGTGYFGCRTEDGGFDAERFRYMATLPEVKMIEIKLSQGAKPSHGGLLPGAKVNAEIAEARGIPIGRACESPAKHSAFADADDLCHFIAQLRELSGGKPVGFKLCIGHPDEFIDCCAAMKRNNILPDFITVDGAEGGTGAAPVEFTDSLGMPINDAIVFVDTTLRQAGLRDNIRIIASGKVASGFDMIVKIALGADACNSARAMMFAIGCIQALRCHANTCPTGVTSQDKNRYYALVPDEKKHRVANYHAATVRSFLDILGAMGLSEVNQLSREHIVIRD